MAKKSRRPALYELIRGRVGSGVSVPDRGVTESETASVDASTSWLSPGRRLRVPVGYLVLLGAGVIAMAVVAYMAGYRVGQRDAEAEFGGRPFNALVTGGPVSDPLVQASEPQAEPGGSRGGESHPSGDRGPNMPPGDNRATIPTQREAWGELESDPRQAGLSYFVLAETRQEGAQRLAEFCRANGLEAYVVPGHNARFRCVAVLPGFQTRAGPQVQRMRDEIHRIGSLWKSRYPVESDLKDAYLQ